MPNDLGLRIARLAEQIEGQLDRIGVLEAQQAAERGTRRSARHVLARHDERGRATGYQLAGERGFLGQAIERRNELSEVQAVRDSMIAERGEVSERLSLLDAEIDRRINRRIDLYLLSPGGYLNRELGERPDDPELDEVWREGVGIVERFRFEHDITHERIAFFGHDPREIRGELAPIKEELDLGVPAVGMRMRR